MWISTDPRIPDSTLEWGGLPRAQSEDGHSTGVAECRVTPLSIFGPLDCQVRLCRQWTEAYFKSNGVPGWQPPWDPVGEKRSRGLGRTSKTLEGKRVRKRGKTFRERKEPRVLARTEEDLRGKKETLRDPHGGDDLTPEDLLPGTE